ncbi:MAG: hypothetical protein JWL59_4428 [Chthoniobacteraceae bacterium]|nr:hypothetical protein [Chthoniobacteraceae bacterium]
MFEFGAVAVTFFGQRPIALHYTTRDFGAKKPPVVKLVFAAAVSRRPNVESDAAHLKYIRFTATHPRPLKAAPEALENLEKTQSAIE